MISKIELKKSVAGTGSFGVIVGKLCHEKKLYPIILLEVNKSLKVGFHPTILPFSLPVYLGVESG